MKLRSLALHLSALFVPVVLAGFSSLLLGWPVRFPGPSVFVTVALWLALTIYIGVKWSRRNSSASSMGNCALVGFLLGTATLLCAFFVPTIIDECGTVSYRYSLPSLNQWVHDLAERPDGGGCGR
ncbi:hypothetical protein EON83_19910 [bacterium]|nr:MAG: hypothetical protein EON83_19910 [bacterium]